MIAPSPIKIVKLIYDHKRMNYVFFEIKIVTGSLFFLM